MSVGSIVVLAAERVVDPVEGMHHAIARPWLAAVGGPAATAYELATRTAYGLVRLGAAVVGAGLQAAKLPSSAGARAFVNGLWGDELGPHQASLDTPMTLRDRLGKSVQPSDMVPAGGNIVVLVHGLMATEEAWHGSDSEPGLLTRLEDESEFTPVAVRYNSGLPIADNGARLAALLKTLHAGWPVPVDSISLVGYSMGGLVIHRACAAAHRSGDEWLEDVRDVVTIGAPHRGAPMEKAVWLAAGALRRFRHTRPLADFLDTRSEGIRDLRAGSRGLVAHEEWGALAQDARHHFIAGVVTSDPDHPIGALVGDLMVRPSSGADSPPLEPATVSVLGGVHHFDLLNDPPVVDTVMRWITSAA